jgi:hypothetical protein
MATDHERDAMPPQAKMEKYLFNAQAVALQGSIRKPYFQELGDHLAISTYAHSAGRTEATHRDFALGEDIRYEFARTSIEAVETGTVRETRLIAQVVGLRIGRRLSVGEVTCQLHSLYDSRTYPGRCRPRILPAGSTIRELRIDGSLQELHLPKAFNAEEEREAFFRGEREEDRTLQPGGIPEPIHVRDLGTIFYAEWTWVYPDKHEQRLTMLRLALGSDLGAQIVVAMGGTDGTGWPPTVN